MTLEKLHEIREEIDKRRMMAPNAMDDDYLVGYGSAIAGVVSLLDAAIAEERAKPGPRDVVLFVTDGVEPEPTTWKRGMSATDPLGKTHVVVLMRAAEVERKIEEARP